MIASAALGPLLWAQGEFIVPRRGDLPVLNWMPTTEGFQDVRNILRELIGQAVGA